MHWEGLWAAAWREMLRKTSSARALTGLGCKVRPRGWWKKAIWMLFQGLIMG